MTDTRICSKCGQEFPLTSEFWYKRKSNKDGYSTECKECCKVRASKWQKENREKRREISHRYMLKNLEKTRTASLSWYYRNREKQSKRALKWSQDNHDRKLETNRKWRADNRQKQREYHILWCENNPEKAKAKVNRRRARRVHAEGNFTSDHIKSLYDFQEGRCFHCDCDISAYYEIDHWIPLSKGGSNWPENLRLLCQFCNRSKGDRFSWEWHPEIYPNPKM